MRLIDADALIKAFDPDHYFDWYTPSIIETINEQPTVELPVRGEWINDFKPPFFGNKCSACGYPSGSTSFNFCPYCGADMRKESGLNYV